MTDVALMLAALVLVASGLALLAVDEEDE